MLGFEGEAVPTFSPRADKPKTIDPPSLPESSFLADAIINEDRGLITLPNGITVFYAESMDAIRLVKGKAHGDISLAPMEEDSDIIFQYEWDGYDWNLLTRRKVHESDDKPELEPDSSYIEECTACDEDRCCIVMTRDERIEELEYECEELESQVDHLKEVIEDLEMELESEKDSRS